RRSQTRPGPPEEWVHHTDEGVTPDQDSEGRTETASFTDDDDPDGYVWIRSFNDEAHRAAVYAATPEDTRWTDHIFPAIGELLLIERTVATRAIPTPASPLR